MVDPDAVIAQIKGGTTTALSSVLAGSLAFGRDDADSPSLPAGQAPGPADAPKIEVLLLDRPDLPSTGVGATPLIALAPAIANAIFAATGQRLHSMPPIR